MTESDFQVNDVANHPARIPDEALIKQCQLEFLRRSGPGGQHRNKVETAVLIKHEPTGISAEANESRSQNSNRQSAIHRLRLKLAVQVRTCEQNSAFPTELWKSRVTGKKLIVAREHRDYPSLLTEAIDVLTLNDWDHSKASVKLGISGSQLIKFLATYHPAMQLVNDHRIAKGLHALKAN